MHLDRRPAGSAAFPEDVEEHAEREFGICRRSMISGLSIWYSNRQAVRPYQQTHGRRFLVIRNKSTRFSARPQVGDEIGVAPHAQVARLELMANHNPKLSFWVRREASSNRLQ